MLGKYLEASSRNGSPFQTEVFTDGLTVLLLHESFSCKLFAKQYFVLAVLYQTYACRHLRSFMDRQDELLPPGGELFS